MNKTLYNEGWSFSLGGETFAGLNIEGFRDAEPQTVTLPHDFIISKEVSPSAAAGRASGYYEGDIGYYSNTLWMPEELPGSVFLDFDGVYRNCEIKVNGLPVCEHKYGYTPFLADITKYLRAGSNDISVMADTLPDPNCRWYSGGGIFRDVHLLTGAARHIAPRSMFVSTLSLAENSTTVQVELTLEGEKTSGEEIIFTLYDESGTVVVQKTHKLPPHGRDMVREVFTVENARLWNTETPNLYAMKAELVTDGEITDTASETFGIRTVVLDGAKGIFLNGKSIKLHGGCVHHDNGVIGAVSVYAAEERRVKKLKAAGYNAIRTAHNPPSSALLEACDRCGILVLDEAFDMWVTAKGTYDYHRDFRAHWREDIFDMVKQGRNHPSVIMWSVGNEIGDMGSAHGLELMRKLVDAVREADSTRPVIVGGITIEKWDPDELEEVMQKYGVLDGTVSEMSAEMEKMFPPTTDASITKAVADYTGVIDTHYSYFRYPSLIKKYPNAAIMGTESYAQTSDLIKEIMDEHPEVIGDFVWTCWDHIGEAGLGRCVHVPKEEERTYNNVFAMMDIMMRTEYPYRLSNCADFDINGILTVQGIFRKIVWGDEGTCIAVQPPAYHGLAEIKVLGFSWTEEKQSWNFEGEEGKPVRVNVYSGAEWVELFLNEKSLGRKPAGKKVRYCASFELEYEPGTLTAVSCKDGKEVSRCTIETTGKAVKIKAVPENMQAKAGVDSLIFVPIELIDSEGRRACDAEFEVSAEVTGEGSLLGFGSAAPITDENYSSGQFKSYEGRLLAVVRSTGVTGEAVLRLKAEGFAEEMVTLNFN